MNMRHVRNAATIAAIAGTTLIAASPAGAGFVLTGDVNQMHDGSDPWILPTSIIIGVTGNGSLRIDNGSVLDVDLGIIGDAAGSSGTVDVIGAGSRWDGLSILAVGNSGSGALNIFGGASVTSNLGVIGLNAGSFGTATVGGGRWTNEALLVVGNSGAGDLFIRDSGTVTAPTVSIGSVAGSTGRVFLQQNRARLDVENAIYVGGAAGGAGGSGLLRIDFGGASIGDLAIASDGDLIISDSSFTDTQLTIYADGETNVLQDSILGVNANEFGKAVVTGSGALWTTRNLWVGQGGTGTIDIEDGGSVLTANDVLLGINATAAGTVTVDGAGSELKTEANIVVGHEGVGALSVRDGGTATGVDSVLGQSTGSTGLASVNGAGSEWNSSGSLTVGGSGFANVSVNDGGKLSSDTGVIGDGAGSNGTVILNDAGSTWTNAQLEVGRSGEGDLRVRSGASVETTGLARVGAAVGGLGEVTVEGDGSLWRQATLFIGDFGDGKLTIQNGGSVETTAFASLGEEPGGVGEAIVDGEGSSWTQEDLFVGWSTGRGELTVSNGASVHTARVGFIGGQSGSTGAATVSGDGSEWIVRDTMTVGRLGTGSLRVDQGGFVSVADVLRVGFGANSSGAVEVDGPGSHLESLGSLLLGGDRASNMTVSNGGELTTRFATISTVTPGEVSELRLKDGGSEWESNDELIVGDLGDGEVLISNGANLTTNGTTRLALNGNAYGGVIIQDDGSRWESFADVFIGAGALGSVNVLNGGTLDAGTNVTFGLSNGSSGSGVVRGPGSTMGVTGNLQIGVNGNGSLLVDQMAELTVNGDLSLGVNGEINGALRADNPGTQINVDGHVTVADQSFGGLILTDGASMSAGSLTVAAQSGGSFGSIAMTGGATLDIDNQFALGQNGLAEMTMSGGSVATVGGAAIFGEVSSGNAFVEDSELSITEELVIAKFGRSRVSVSEGGSLSADWVQLGARVGSKGELGVGGDETEARSTTGFEVGASGEGILTVVEGAKVFGADDTLGRDGLGSGFALLAGMGTSWTNSTLEVGRFGFGQLDIFDGAEVHSTLGVVGAADGGNGVALVSGDDALWQLQDLFLASSGDASLTIENGGEVNVTNTVGMGVADASGLTDAYVTVDGAGSALRVNQGLTLGAAADTIVRIENDGLVTVGTDTVIGEFGAVDLLGGRFEFGAMSQESFRRINGVSGSLAGSLSDIELTGFNRITDASFGALFGDNISDDVDTSGVTAALSNSGELVGDGFSRFDITNNAPGVIDVIALERMRFGGDGVNNGRMSVSAGQLRFGGDLINNSEIDINDGSLIVGGTFSNGLGGFVEGRGVIRTEGGLTNNSEMRFSGGQTDFHGTVTNDTFGIILTTGGGVTTFFDDATHNGVEIETSAGSFTVFLGTYSGDGDFTGAGEVRYEGLIDLGNSPASVSFEGDVNLAATSLTNIELGGLSRGEFDAFEIGGDLDIAGALGVELIDGFGLGLNYSFLIANVAGSRTGFFSGLTEGSLVSSFGGTDLFITYSAGDGNDVALYTVPAPGPAALYGLGLLTMTARRRRASC